MTIGKIRLPIIASLLIWAALWEIVGRNGRQFHHPAAVANIFARIVEIVPTAVLRRGAVDHRARPSSSAISSRSSSAFRWAC